MAEVQDRYIVNILASELSSPTLPKSYWFPWLHAYALLTWPMKRVDGGWIWNREVKDCTGHVLSPGSISKTGRC